MRGKNWPLFVFFAVLILGCENPLKSHLAEQKGKSQIAGFAATPMRGDSSPYTKVFGGYDVIRVALSQDHYNIIEAGTQDLLKEVDEAPKKGSNTERLEKVKGSVVALSKEKEPEKLRAAFGKLSENIVDLYKNSGSLTMELYHCPMANGYGYWLQPKNEPIHNPYMGTKMVSCGSKVELH